MRDLFKLLVIGIAILFTPQVFAENYKVLIIPDNVVTDNVAVDSYIYNATAEFFADEVANILNSTDYIDAPYVSEIRTGLKQDPSAMIAAKKMTSKFRTTYNIDYSNLKKITDKTDAKYALLLTSYIDSENYILRRTVWDFLNIPGATVIDPAYKISTYAALIDTETNRKIWADTFYKTISVCENRIITRGPSPQTEQLQKIKDYSRLICPQIAKNVQRNILPADLYAQETTQIDYDLSNIDNVFTKKYRQLKDDTDKIYNQKKQEFGLFLEDSKQKIEHTTQEWQEKKAIKDTAKQAELESKLEVKATPVYENTDKNFKGINFKKFNPLKPSEYVTPLDDSFLEPIEINKTRKNNLYGDYETDRPDLREYY